jgi:hypothetical protein
MCKKLTLKTNLCSAAVFCALLAVSSQAATIGAGADITATTLDNDTNNGIRLNITREYSEVLPNGRYEVSEFAFNASPGNGSGFIRPFLAKRTSSNPLTYETVWVGPRVTVTVDDVDTADFARGAETFTLSQSTEVFGGVYHADTAKVYCVLNVGTTDHDNSGVTEPTGAGQTVGDFTHGNLPRTYAFGLTVMVGGSHPFSSRPHPADDALLEATWANLSWSPGDSAVSHDVYLGESFDDVNNGTADTFVGNQAETTLIVGFPGFPVPDGLVPGTTYYWRIDEVNDANAASPWEGNVWSFSIQPYTAFDPDPADGAESVALDAELSWTGGFSAKLHTVYFGDNFDDVSNAAGGLLQGDSTFTPPGPLELAKTYYWRVDEFDPPTTYKGEVWSFRTEGTAADPYPAREAVDVSPTPILKWTAGNLAASHEVYFGADADAVKNADKTSPEHKGTQALGEESYDAGRIELETTYYWRIDEVNSTNPGSPWIGNVWSFTTGDFLVVDDFESYNDIDPPDPNSNRIFDKWIDGFGTTTNGALVGNDMPPYAEQGIVHGGAQSMPYLYDNNLKTSEATLTLVYPKDWTEEGVTKLSLWFRGTSANAADRMFVALGNAVVYHDDPAATQIGGWNEWVIDLAAFGVDLTNVNTITIGIGTKNSPAAGGTGTMYFDDIRLIR